MQNCQRQHGDENDDNHGYESKHCLGRKTGSALFGCHDLSPPLLLKVWR